MHTSNFLRSFISPVQAKFLRTMLCASGNSSRVAVAQMTSTGDMAANFQCIEALAENAINQRCQMLFLPENFNFLGGSSAESVTIAEPLTGPIINKYRDLARRLTLWLSLGGFQERGPDSHHIFNTHLIINSSGDVESVYRKVHLFNVDIPGGPVLKESSFTSPGRQLVACRSPVGTLGLSVCYDLRFPELYQKLTFDMGCQVLLVPAAFTVPTGKAHWEVLLKARAIETQTYVIAAAQAGEHNKKRHSFGHSLIVDPWGEVIARLEDGDRGVGIAVADIDLDKVSDVRQRMPVAQHRELGRTCLGV